jgi:hypothetical protein
MHFFYALKIRNVAIPIDLELKLFDSLITPILVYCCEVWGFENKQGIKKMHLQYYKIILNLRSSTPNVMVYGEIGPDLTISFELYKNFHYN